MKAAQSSKAKIFIVDDHPVFRMGLAALIEAEGGLCVVGEAAGSAEAMRILKSVKPNIAIVDLSLAEGSGLQLIKSIRNNDKSIGILVASMHDEAIYAERTLRLGADGYINKEQAAAKIIDAIKRVLSGKVYLSDEMSEAVLHNKLYGKHYDGSQQEDALSDRELEVFTMIGQGLSSRDIAERLHLSPKTIDSHREHIKDKLRLKNNAALIQRAVSWVLSEAQF